MHSRRKGKHGSKRPIRDNKPVWVKHSPQEVEQLIIKFGKEGIPPSKIGLILRDKYGIPNVKEIIKKGVKSVLAENKLLPEVPEDFIALIKKEIKVTKHLERNKKDMPTRRGFQLTESKIRRLMKYYKRKGILPEDWKYDKEQAKLLIGGG